MVAYISSAYSSNRPKVSPKSRINRAISRTGRQPDWPTIIVRHFPFDLRPAPPPSFPSTSVPPPTRETQDAVACFCPESTVTGQTYLSCFPSPRPAPRRAGLESARRRGNAYRQNAQGLFRRFGSSSPHSGHPKSGNPFKTLYPQYPQLRHFHRSAVFRQILPPANMIHAVATTNIVIVAVNPTG